MPRKSAVPSLSDKRLVYHPFSPGGPPLILFFTSAAQYKYQINKKWRLRKYIPESKKVAMNHRYQHLSTASMTAVIKYKGQEVDPRKLRRQAKTEIRRNLKGVQADGTRPNDTVSSSPLASPAVNL